MVADKKIRPRLYQPGKDKPMTSIEEGRAVIHIPRFQVGIVAEVKLYQVSMEHAAGQMQRGMTQLQGELGQGRRQRANKTVTYRDKDAQGPLSGESRCRGFCVCVDVYMGSAGGIGRGSIRACKQPYAVGSHIHVRAP
eukprot:TRINITY_DN11138_c0_g1_i1.p2 TRINITY_DN11138_c0_g1~~TRINITY_DN11138_c0_g1_i1.p2  ORF type:complete len:138 (-),score=6.67 TRINITY_DN11138_c0_g1_i1:741-1154(-)